MRPLLQISNLSISLQVRKTEFYAVKNLNLSINDERAEAASFTMFLFTSVYGVAGGELKK